MKLYNGAWKQEPVMSDLVPAHLILYLLAGIWLGFVFCGCVCVCGGSGCFIYLVSCGSIHLLAVLMPSLIMLMGSVKLICCRARSG